MDVGCGLQTLYSCKCWVLFSVHVGQHNPAKFTGEQYLLYMCFLFIPLTNALSVTLAMYIKHFYRICSDFSTVVKYHVL